MKKSILFITGLCIFTICNFVTAYTVELDPLTPLTDYVGLGEWNTDGDFQNWTTNVKIKNATVTAGNFIGIDDGNDPIMNLDISALASPNPRIGHSATTGTVFEIRMQIAANSGNLRIDFFPTISGLFKTPPLHFANNEIPELPDIPVDGAFHVFRMTFGAEDSNYLGTIDKVRFDPLADWGPTGEIFKVDYFRIAKVITPVKVDPVPIYIYTSLAEWNTNNNFESWSFGNIINSNVTGGVLSGEPTSNDPIIGKNSADGLPSVDLDLNPIIEFRLKHISNISSSVQIYFNIPSAERVVTIPENMIPTDGNFHIYQYNMSNHEQWTDFLTGFRFDPYTVPAAVGKQFEIDYIRIGVSEMPIINPFATEGTYSNKVDISWDENNIVNKYQVWRNTIDDSSSAITNSPELTTNFYSDFNVSLDTKYYYWIKTFITNHWGNFGSSARGFATTSTGPNKPTNISPADGVLLPSFPVIFEADNYSDAGNWPFVESKWQVSSKDSFSSSKEFKGGDTNIIEVSSGLIFTGTNFWRVSYKSDRNKWSDWSDSTSFIINRDVNSHFYFYDSFNNVAGSGNANSGYYNSGRQFGAAAPLDYSINGTTEVGQSATAPNQLTLTDVASVSPNYSFTDYTNFVIEFDVFPANSSWTAISFGKTAQNAFPISIGGVGIVFFGAGASATGAYQVFSSETLIGTFAGAPNFTNMRVKIAVTTETFDYDAVHLTMFINGKPMPLKQDSFIDPNPTNNHPIYFYTLEKGNGFGENFVTLYNNGDVGTIDNFKISPCGAKLSTRIWENDNNMWIGSSNDIAEFTHAVNLNWDSEITVDGLPFEAPGEIGVLQTNDSIPQVNGSDWCVFGADGNISAGQFEFDSAPLPSGSGADIAKYFFYGWGSSIGITLSNLTPGSSNIFYIYGRPFANTGSRHSYISGSDGGIFLVDENDQPDKCQIISYEYLANSDGTFSLTFTPMPNQDYILYGFSSVETGIPEPFLFILIFAGSFIFYWRKNEKYYK